MKPETDLVRDLELARAECNRLREENAWLKQLLNREKLNAGVDSVEGQTDKPTGNANPFESIENKSIGVTQAAVTNASAPSMKIDLFRQLFRGREDVYAVRWVGRNGKSGYLPAALRDEKSRLRTNYKNRKCFPLTDIVVRDHLLGKHTIGIYPLLPKGGFGNLLALDQTGSTLGGQRENAASLK